MVIYMEFKIGMRVSTKEQFVCRLPDGNNAITVPKGTKGIIETIYSSGFNNGKCLVRADIPKYNYAGEVSGRNLRPLKETYTVIWRIMGLSELEILRIEEDEDGNLW